MSMAKEFKEFISRGNVVDLAVGVIIGGAFGAIVTSLVKDVVMPPIGYMMSGIDFSTLKTGRCSSQFRSRPQGPVQDHHSPGGRHCVRCFYQYADQFPHRGPGDFPGREGREQPQAQEAEAPAEPVAPTTDQKLLMEIRDLLAKK